jgi:hypothetical protein
VARCREIVTSSPCSACCGHAVLHQLDTTPAGGVLKSQSKEMTKCATSAGADAAQRQPRGANRSGSRAAQAAAAAAQCSARASAVAGGRLNTATVHLCEGCTKQHPSLRHAHTPNAFVQDSGSLPALSSLQCPKTSLRPYVSCALCPAMRGKLPRSAAELPPTLKAFAQDSGSLPALSSLQCSHVDSLAMSLRHKPRYPVCVLCPVPGNARQVAAKCC